MDEHLLRELTPQVIGAIVRRYGDFAAAEDAVQDALIAAATQWPTDGVPGNPRGWLIQVAARRMTDHIRAEAARRRREETWEPAHADQAQEDDTLILLFMCCHPSLSDATAIALTLRAVGGLTTAEIAHAFMVPEPTMAQRISRAKQQIKKSGLGFELPSESERAARLGAVLHVLYLIFNEGYVSSHGDSLQRRDLANEAIRLARIVRHAMPNHTEAAGLLALMLLTDARRHARTGPDNELIPLDEQDRSKWDQGQIADGVALVSETLARGSIGPYQIQAAIAAVHDEAGRAEDTDWPQIVALYSLLNRMSDNPMVALNHAIAVAMVNGPDAGLELIAALDNDERIASHYRLQAVRAHLYERAGKPQTAIELYLAAANRTASTPERDYLIRRAARLALPLL